MPNTNKQPERTIHQFVEDERITMTAERCDSNPYMDSKDMDHWKVTLQRRPFAGASAGDRKRFTTYFSMGFGHKGAEPTAEDVLSCLASDVSDESFEDWCHELGFDEDSRKAERTYKITQRQTAKLRLFLGGSFETLVYHTERL